MITALLSGSVSPMPQSRDFTGPMDFFIRASGSIYDDILSYDDGSAYWLVWDGVYRGTWFDLTEFWPPATHLYCYYTEYWFYHHSSHPWDTSSFYAELWNGDAACPQTRGPHFHDGPALRPRTCRLQPIHRNESNFWAIINTTMSDGGWPSLLADNTPNSTAHSFCSDDFILWESWPEFQQSLQRSSWAGIKGLFR
jgi:hypothetical protein